MQAQERSCDFAHNELELSESLGILPTYLLLQEDLAFLNLLGNLLAQGLPFVQDSPSAQASLDHLGTGEKIFRQ